MKIPLIYGDEKKLNSFISQITKKDKIAIISHKDLDGMVPVLIFEKVFGKIDILEFDSPKKDLILNLIPKLKEEKITKVIITDLNLNNEQPETQVKLEEFAEVLIIDHHQSIKDFNSSKTVFMLTEKKFNAGLSTYCLLGKFKPLDSIDFLVAMSIITDHNWNDNAKFIKMIEKKYGLKEAGDINKSELGIFTIILGNYNTFLKEDPFKFYNILRKINSLKDIKKLEKYSEEVEKDIKNTKEDFLKNKEDHIWGYIYHDKSKYGVATKAIRESAIYKDSDLVIVYREKDDGVVHMAARRDDGKLNCADILKKAIFGLRDASGGGHIPAAGARVRKEDFLEFKKNLIKILGN
jgi:oligoribonuclease NrnB/cAMP/cGMP phosphodiesterase (DHH superfamily)